MEGTGLPSEVLAHYSECLNDGQTGGERNVWDFEVDFCWVLDFGLENLSLTDNKHPKMCWSVSLSFNDRRRLKPLKNGSVRLCVAFLTLSGYTEGYVLLLCLFYGLEMRISCDVSSWLLRQLMTVDCPLGVSQCVCVVVYHVCLCLTLWWTGDLPRVYSASRPVISPVHHPARTSRYRQWMDQWILNRIRVKEELMTRIIHRRPVFILSLWL